MKIEGNEKCLGFQLLWCSVIPVFGCYSGILGTFLKYLDNANIILMKQNFLLKHKIFPSLERMMKLKVQHNKQTQIKIKTINISTQININVYQLTMLSYAYTTEVYSEPCLISMMERFLPKIVLFLPKRFIIDF